jgi:CRP/FNR family transcriptional regulator, cyclic AMP receptor protein
MACNPEVLKDIPLFSLLDDDEIAVLAAQVEIRKFTAHSRIYKIGEAGGQAYVMLSGKVRVSTVDDDQQEVIVDEPGKGEFFGFASMVEQTPHQTSALVLEDSECLEISRDDIVVLIEKKPHAGMDLLTTLSRQIHAAQSLVRNRASRNPNDLIEEESTFGQRLADSVARFGGSWAFIMSFGVLLAVYTIINIFLDKKAWDPYPFILLNLFLSMLAAIQAPVIMMSQNRQDIKDRLRSELDFDVNRRAESEIQGLARKLNLLEDKIDDLGTIVRK